MCRLSLMVGLFTVVSACHTVPNPTDPARQDRIDDCLKQCGSGEPPTSNTAYAADPVARQDTRSTCEKRCHSIP